MAYGRIKPSDVHIGRPLQWDVFDEKGNLLLGKGHVISSENQLVRLLQLGMFADNAALQRSRGDVVIDETLPPSTVTLLLVARKKLEALFTQLEQATLEDNFVARMHEIVAHVEGGCSVNPNVALAMILLRQDGRYAIRHMVNAAVVVNLVCKSMGKTEDERRRIVAATLSMNFGMMDYQDKLKQQTTPLTPEQRAELEQHPFKSRELLANAGVMDELWLTAVLQHHEYIDGSGYPGKLKGDSVCQEAQLVSLADLFCARVTPRAYRAAVASNVALRGILLDRGKAFNPLLAAHFIKTLGIYPAGMMVKLANGEIGLVSEPTEKANCPIVSSFIGPRGAPLTIVLKRDTSLDLYAIRETVDPKSFAVHINMENIWGSAAVEYRI